MKKKNAYSYNLIVDRCKCNMDRLKDKCLHDQFGSLRTTQRPQTIRTIFVSQQVEL